MKKWMLSSLLIMGSFSLLAADDNLTDLLNALSTTKKDTVRVIALRNLGDYYKYKNSDSAIYFYREAVHLAEELEYTKGLVWSTKSIGEVYENYGNRTAAMRIYKKVERMLDSTHYGEYEFRVSFLNSLFYYYQVSLPDSSLYFGKLKVDLAKRHKDQFEEAFAYSQMAYCVYLTGNYPFALELNLRAIELYEKIKRPDFLKDSYFQIGMIFEAQENFQSALENFFKAYELAAPTNDGLLIYIYMHLGVCYVGTNQLDSAMKYCGLTLEMFTRGNVNKYKGAMLKNLGVVHEKRGEDGIALEYYRSAVQHDLTQKGEYLLSLDYIALAKYFYKKNQLDSCIYYANEASMLAIHSSVIKNIMEASDLLTKAYQAKGKIDSAFKYQGIGVMAKDSLFSQEKTRHVQFLSYKEEQRQKQIAEDKELAKEVRKKNLQLFGISIFLISFILFLILLSRRRIKPRTIQFFGVFALLMVFEFINLFIHPFIEELTHHSQVEMLLILVAIAAILVPMHHRLEKWVKNSLAKKKMLIRDPGLTEDEMGTAPILVESKQPLK